LVGVAVKVTLVPAQIAPAGTAAIATLGTAMGFTVMVMAFEVTGFGCGHTAFEVITTLMTSPLFRVAEVYVTPVAPGIFTPPRVHCQLGAAPPLVGVAVKVTLVPAQIAPAGTAAILTLGTAMGFTVIVMALLVTGFGCGQTAFEVITTLMTSPLFRVALVYVTPVAPGILTPPRVHW
jgi:6,7-dimethyl-8-ribityllumazine synthase